ncbi:hypothetical protein OY671_009071, partial [Metschnikowia pulcherrima]
IKDRGQIFRVDVDTIERIEAAGDYMCIYTGDNSSISRETMKDLERRSDPRVFQRVHRSKIVNLDQVRQVRPHTNGECFLVLKSGAEVKVSRSYRNVVARFGQGMTDFALPGFDLSAFVSATSDEDFGVGSPGGGHDVTSESVIPATARFAGVMESRDAITVCGSPIAAAFFRALDPAMAVEILVEEGARVAPGSASMRSEGNARAMSTAERSA